MKEKDCLYNRQSFDFPVSMSRERSQTIFSSLSSGTATVFCA